MTGTTYRLHEKSTEIGDFRAFCMQFVFSVKQLALAELRLSLGEHETASSTARKMIQIK